MRPVAHNKAMHLVEKVARVAAFWEEVGVHWPGDNLVDLEGAVVLEWDMPAIDYGAMLHTTIT